MFSMNIDLSRIKFGGKKVRARPLCFLTRLPALAIVLSASVAWAQDPPPLASPYDEAMLGSSSEGSEPTTDAREEQVHTLPTSRPVESPRTLDSGGNEFEHAEPEPVDPCDLWDPAVQSFSTCSTPRQGVLSGGYFGLDVGYATIAADAADADGIGPGAGVHFRLGFEFWDHLFVASGIGGLLLSDRAPIYEMVVDCTSVNGQVVGCGDQAHEQGSNVSATLLLAEVGLQHRFRPALTLSWLPGIAVGYQRALSDLSRSVDCKGCTSIDLDASASGVYLGPFFRVTFGNLGAIALIVRSQWYLTSDVIQMSSLGIECGLP